VVPAIVAYDPTLSDSSDARGVHAVDSLAEVQ